MKLDGLVGYKSKQNKIERTMKMKNLLKELYENQKLNEACLELMTVLKTKGFDPSFHKEPDEGSYLILLDRKDPRAIHHITLNRVKNTIEYIYGIDDENLWIETETHISKYKLSTIIKLIEKTISTYDN